MIEAAIGPNRIFQCCLFCLFPQSRGGRANVLPSRANFPQPTVVFGGCTPKAVCERKHTHTHQAIQPGLHHVDASWGTNQTDEASKESINILMHSLTLYCLLTWPAERLRPSLVGSNTQASHEAGFCINLFQVRISVNELSRSRLGQLVALKPPPCVRIFSAKQKIQNFANHLEAATRTRRKSSAGCI